MQKFHNGKLRVKHVYYHRPVTLHFEEICSNKVYRIDYDRLYLIVIRRVIRMVVSLELTHIFNYRWNVTLV